jgi:Na+-transporting NADH:ubiquinone oxidoreductase subunit NqrB
MGSLHFLNQLLMDMTFQILRLLATTPNVAICRFKDLLSPFSSIFLELISSIHRGSSGSKGVLLISLLGLVSRNNIHGIRMVLVDSLSVILRKRVFGVGIVSEIGVVIIRDM